MLFKVRSPFLVEKDYKERTTVSEIDLKSDDEMLQQTFFFKKKRYTYATSRNKNLLSL